MLSAASAKLLHSASPTHVERLARRPFQVQSPAVIIALLTVIVPFVIGAYVLAPLEATTAAAAAAAVLVPMPTPDTILPRT